MRCKITKEISSDIELSNIEPGEYYCSRTTHFTRQNGNQPAYSIAVQGLPVKISMERFNVGIDTGYIELLPETEGGDEMSNLPAPIIASDTSDPFALMDRMDDEIIMAELENRVVNTWVYSFDSDGKPQMGLSKKGVDEACTEMAKQGHLIEEKDVTWEKCPISPEHVVFKALVQRILINKDGIRVPMETVFGTKRQGIKEARRNGSMVDDKFWLEKGAAKALRNARSRLIPAEIQAKIISVAKQQGKVKEVKPKSEQQPKPKAQKPSPADMLKALKKELLSKAQISFNDNKQYALEFITWCLELKKAEEWTIALLQETIENFDELRGAYDERDLPV